MAPTITQTRIPVTARAIVAQRLLCVKVVMARILALGTGRFSQRLATLRLSQAAVARALQPVGSGCLFSRCACLLILVFPLGGDDGLDPPHRELHSGRKRIADVLRPKPMNTEERLLVLRPALKLAL